MNSLAPALFWIDVPELQNLNPKKLSQVTGLTLNKIRKNKISSPAKAIVNVPQEQTPLILNQYLRNIPTLWLDLALEAGQGDQTIKQVRAAAALARTAGQLAHFPALIPTQSYSSERIILVAGAGMAALESVRQAVNLKYSVILASPFDSPILGGVDDPHIDTYRFPLNILELKQVKIYTKYELTSLKGTIGNFEVLLQGPNGLECLRVSAVIIAPPANWSSITIPSGLTLSRPLSSLDLGEISGTPDSWCQVAILAGTESPLSAAAFNQTLAIALTIAKRPYTQVNFFFCEARVAHPGGERLYRELREAGALMIRLEPGNLQVIEGGQTLVWLDLLLKEKIYLIPDIIAVAEEAKANLPFFFTNLAKWSIWKNLIPEKLYLKTPITTYPGLYILGKNRNTTASLERLSEVAQAISNLHELLSGNNALLSPIVYNQACARCLTCVRVCPHGVPRYENGYIQCAPIACLQCGLCAAQCPGQAIAPPGWSTLAIVEGLRRGLALIPSPKLILIICAHSGMAALRELATQNAALWPKEILFLPVPCLGRIDKQIILSALEAGANGILIANCHHGNCRSLIKNSNYISSRLETYLSILGINLEQIRILHLAANQSRELLNVLTSMLISLKKSSLCT